MSTTVGSDSFFRDGFIEAAARAFFVMAYADFVESDEGQDLPRPGGGQDWYDFAPEAPPNAYALAGELWEALCRLNPGESPYTLAAMAEKADGKLVDCQEFGRDLAMMRMGTGVSWFDNHAKFPLEVGDVEVSAFTFDESCYQE